MFSSASPSPSSRAPGSVDKIQQGETLLNGRRFATSARVREGDEITVAWRGPVPDAEQPRRRAAGDPLRRRVVRRGGQARRAGVAPVRRDPDRTLIQQVRQYLRSSTEARMVEGDRTAWPAAAVALHPFTSGIVLVAEDRSRAHGDAAAARRWTGGEALPRGRRRQAVSRNGDHRLADRPRGAMPRAAGTSSQRNEFRRGHQDGREARRPPLPGRIYPGAWSVAATTRCSTQSPGPGGSTRSVFTSPRSATPSWETSSTGTRRCFFGIGGMVAVSTSRSPRGTCCTRGGSPSTTPSRAGDSKSRRRCPKIS